MIDASAAPPHQASARAAAASVRLSRLRAVAAAAALPASAHWPTPAGAGAASPLYTPDISVSPAWLVATTLLRNSAWACLISPPNAEMRGRQFVAHGPSGLARAASSSVFILAASLSINAR